MIPDCASPPLSMRQLEAASWGLPLRMYVPAIQVRLNKSTQFTRLILWAKRLRCCRQPCLMLAGSWGEHQMTSMKTKISEGHAIDPQFSPFPELYSLHLVPLVYSCCIGALLPSFHLVSCSYAIRENRQPSPTLFSAGLAVYSEYASMFPQRSGGEVVYLEKAYPHPRFLAPIAFSVTAVLMSFVRPFSKGVIPVG